jgi:MFS family permease
VAGSLVVTRSRAAGSGLAAVLGLLMATGWAANHLAALIPVLSSREGLSHTLLDGVFGIYALGLLPGLSAGGGLSDRLGRATVVVPGAVVAATGNAVLLVWQEPAGLLLGRFVVGLGAGLAFGAGTAWAADLGGKAGTVLAGVLLTAGFGAGPLVSGVLAQWAPAPLHLPFVLSIALSLAAVAWAVLAAVPVSASSSSRGSSPPGRAVAGPWTALAWSLPVALLVFASATLPLVTLPARLPERYAGPLLVGLSAALTLGSGIVVQTIARRRSWGPRCGVAGAVASCATFSVAVAGGARVGVPLVVAACLLSGTAYGLCLREGLLDVETLAPADRRGLLLGIFYVVTYVGFGLPVAVEALRSAAGPVVPLAVVAVVAAAAAVARTLQLRGGHPAR